MAEYEKGECIRPCCSVGISSFPHHQSEVPGWRAKGEGNRPEVGPGGCAVCHGWQFLTDFLETRHMGHFDEMFQK